MSHDESAFNNAWCSVMGSTEKQLFCIWHILRKWTKNLIKINGSEKKNIYKTLKSLIYEIDESSFYIEHNQVLNDLLKDPGTSDFGKYFVTFYLTRVEK